MNNFRDIVTNFSIGAISKTKVGFYARRLAKETATRRIASVLMVGLLVLQFVTILAPPKPSYASSPGDLVAGGPFTKDSLISTVWNQNPAGVQQVFNRLQITKEKMQNSTTAQACKGQGWLSMGRNADAGSTQWQPGIYIGPAESRWAQNCFNVMRGTSKIQDTQTGQWYEWGVILDCGNIILKPTSPPPTTPNVVIDCKKLKSDVASPVALGTQITFNGKAVVSQGQVGQDKTVTMSYAVYEKDAPLSNPKSAIKKTTNIPDDPDKSGIFLDPTGQKFTFNDAGTFIVRLGVAYKVAGAADEVLASGSFQGDCAMQIDVNQPKTLQCGSLTLASDKGKAPFVPKLTGKAIKEGTGPGPGLRPSKYVYTQYKQDANGSETYGDKKYTPTGKVITRNNTQTADNLQEFQDPAPPATSFDATEFKTTEDGEYLIILNVFDQNNQQVPTKFRCKKTYTVTSQTLPKTFQCVNLSAEPQSGSSVPFNTTLTAEASVNQTTVKEYQFDFGDGKKQTVASDKLSQSIQHSYDKEGSYTATVTVKAIDNATSTKPSCSVTIVVDKKVVDQKIFRKTVANNTQLTNDGKPTNANDSTARAGDKLTYTIGIANIGTDVVKAFVFEDNISDILQYADIVDNGGGQITQRDNQTFLTWPAIDVPPSTNTNSPTYVTKSFTVQVKNPIPTTAQKPTDKTNFDCKMQDEFFGNIVVTPLSINPAKQLECLAATIPAAVPIIGTLPQTGGAAIPIALISLFAASSLYLFFRNRLLKRELELVETLNEGGPING